LTEKRPAAKKMRDLQDAMRTQQEKNSIEQMQKEKI
jgi:hypothetical protein